jgi:hypothetical protein
MRPEDAAANRALYNAARTRIRNNHARRPMHHWGRLHYLLRVGGHD